MRASWLLGLVVLGSLGAAVASCTSAGSTSGRSEGGSAGDGEGPGEAGQAGAIAAGAGGTSAGSGGTSGSDGGTNSGGAGESGEGDGGASAGAGGADGPSSHTVTVTVAGLGAGTVTSSTGESCGPQNETCELSVAAGERVTFTAAASGAENGFVAWSGACSGSAATCTVTADSNLTLGASFTLMFDLSVRFERSANCGTSEAADVYVTTNVPGLSGMNCVACGSIVCHARFAAGTVLTVTATPGRPTPEPTLCEAQPGVATLASPAITGACTANTTGGGFSTDPASCIVTMGSNASIVVHSCQQSG